MIIDREDTERFWKKVRVGSSEDCWPWTRCLVNGYGRTTICGVHMSAHRVAYQITHPEENIKDKQIRHVCDNPACCNPDHLVSGTHIDNMHDMVKRNRPRGGKGLPPRFYAGEIELIRKLRIIEKRSKPREYKFSAVMVAKMFKTHARSITRIWNYSKHICKEGYYV